MRISPTLAASIGLAILAFAAPGKAHAETFEPEPIAAKRPWVEDDPLLQPETTAPSPPPPTDYASDRDRYARWRISGGIGVRFGSFTVNGDSTGAAIPFHLDLGARHRRLFLFASYDLFSIDANVPTIEPGDTSARAAALTQLGDGSGLVHRVGATARYALARFAEHDGGFDLWTEAGVGFQHVRWDAGGVWTRPDLALGFGATMLYLGKRQHAGASIGLRVMLAPRSDVMGAPAVCGGPCDEATPPSGTDRSFMFDITVPFGL
jgi:hypothetical protein